MGSVDKGLRSHAARATSVRRISVSFEVECRELPSAMLANTHVSNQ